MNRPIWIKTCVEFVAARRVHLALGKGIGGGHEGDESNSGDGGELHVILE